jgi:hypothetical protein
MCLTDARPVAFVLVYTSIFTIIIIQQCDPAEAMWMQFDFRWAAKHKFTCRKIEVQVALAKLAGVLSIVTDFYAVCLPVYLLFQIQMTQRSKIALGFVFGMGMR